MQSPAQRVSENSSLCLGTRRGLRRLEYLLASAHLEGYEVATYNPVILVYRRLGRNGRNEEIVTPPVVISERFVFFLDLDSSKGMDSVTLTLEVGE